MAQTVQLSFTPEVPAFNATDAQKALALLSVTAADADDDSRLPLEVVAVVDRSGSMRGEKMEMMKATLSFLVSKGLQSSDSFGLVTFESGVATPLEMMKMDAAGKRKAADTIAGLRVAGQTNLSGGLLRGIDMQLSSGASQNVTRAVLIFTDGCANQGITNSQGILDAAQGAMAASPMTLYTFGFGSDHNEDLLRSLAESMPGSPGLYYYLQTRESIPQAFADCLGGLVSVVAQNASLRLAPAGGASLVKVLGSHKPEQTASGELTLSLGDLYAEDERDVLVELSLPPLEAPADATLPIARAYLRYFDVKTSSMREVEATVGVSRPAAAEPREQQPANLRLDEQRTRVLAAAAMEAAARLADEGRLDEGRRLLDVEIARAKESPTMGTPLVSALVSDLENVKAGYQDLSAYRGYGQKMSKMTASSYHMQRSNHCSAQVYSKGRKTAMRSRFEEAEGLDQTPNQTPASSSVPSPPASPISKASGKKKAAPLPPPSARPKSAGGPMEWLRRSFSKIDEQGPSLS